MNSTEKLYYTLKLSKNNINGKYFVIEEKEILNKKAKYERKMAKYNANRAKHKSSSQSLKTINKALIHNKELKKPTYVDGYWTNVALHAQAFYQSHKFRLSKEELKQIAISNTEKYIPTKEQLKLKFDKEKKDKLDRLEKLPYNDQFTKRYAFKTDPNTGKILERSGKPHPSKPDEYYKTYNQTQYNKTQRWTIEINTAEGMKTKVFKKIYKNNKDLAMQKAAEITKSNIEGFCGITLVPPMNTKENTIYFSKNHFLKAA